MGSLMQDEDVTIENTNIRGFMGKTQQPALSQETLSQYRSQLRQLGLREQAGAVMPKDVQKRKHLESLLGIRWRDVPGRGRPKVKP